MRESCDINPVEKHQMFFQEVGKLQTEKCSPLRTLLECSASNFVQWYLYFNIGGKKWSQELRTWSQNNEFKLILKQLLPITSEGNAMGQQRELKFCIRVNHFRFIAHRRHVCRVYQLCDTKLPCLRISRCDETVLKLGVTWLKIASGKA